MLRRLTACLISILIIMLFIPLLLAQDDVPPPPPDIQDITGPPGDEAPPSSPPDENATEEPAVTAPSLDNAPLEAIVESPVSGQNWTMFKGDAAHTGYSRESLGYPLKLDWKYIATRLANNPSSPAVADGIVYYCCNTHLYALNADTGTLIWQYPDQEGLTAPIKSSPLVGDDLVYFGGGDGKLYAITKDTGAMAWSFATKGSMNSSPVLSDGVVYIGCTDDHLYAVDARNGQPKWPGGFRTRDDVPGSPAVSDGLVYFISYDMMIYAVHTSSGKIKWADRLGAVSSISSPVVSENTLYLAVGNVVQARQAKSGRLSWGLQLSSDITTVPAVANGSLYVGCKNGKLYAFSSAGKLKWAAPVDLGVPISGSPIVVDDTVIVGGNKGVLAAVDAKTGEVKWKYIVQPSLLPEGRLKYVNIAASPSVSNGTLYVTADDGALLALRYDTPDTTPPQVSTVVPVRGSLMPGAPPIEIAAIVTDPGSGIKVDTIVMSLDDQPVEYKMIPERGIIWYKTPITQPIQPLRDGIHTVALSVSDWAGNKLDMNWSFTVDNRLRRAPKPSSQTPPPGSTTPGGMPGDL